MLADVVHGEDVGWFSAAAARASCSKRRAAPDPVRNSSGQNLDGDLAPEARVARPVHFAHPAGAELGENLVGTQTRTRSEAHSNRNGLYAALNPVR